jgi:2-polyprenyl-3-methyl-5-hydroxy-6-metoxy-1,4-benzoquinol methylase
MIALYEKSSKNMLLNNTDRDWEKYGSSDPYFGVISHNEYRKTNLTDERKELFFKTGEDYINAVTEKVKRYIDPNFKPKKSLDFGCGVGRLVIPLTRISAQVDGIDVSESMLAEARKNCAAQSIENVSFFKSDDELSAIDQYRYDFIHSFIVFQHIPTKRGMKILKILLACLNPGGVGVLHFTYAKSRKISEITTWISVNIPYGGNFIQFLRGGDFFAPLMQMNKYNLNEIFCAIQKENVSNMYIEYINHSGELGVLLFFKKPSS